jgi:branched-chain amino acid transport system permease protein
MKIMNFAHGELYMFGGFVAYYLFAEFGINYIVALVVAIIGMFIVGIVLERLIFRALRGEMHAAFMVSLGLLMVLSTTAAISFGSDLKPVPSFFTGSVKVLGAYISLQRLVVIPISFAIMAGLLFLLHRTRLGMSMRATSEDVDAAALQGVKINKISAIALGIGSSLAAAAGVLMAPIFYVQPTMGFEAVLKAAIIVIFGGLGSLRGAVIAAFILGFAESFAVTMVGGWAKVVGWAIVAIILLLKPQGLFGREEW